MATQNFQRRLEQILSGYAGKVAPGFIHETGNVFYIPFTYDDFVAPDITADINCVTSQTKLTAVTAGGFDNIREGDVLSSLGGSAVFAAKATIDRSCYAPKGQYYVVYPSTFNSGTLGVKAGDAVTSATANVVPSNTVVDKIDYSTNRIYLDKVIGAAGDVIDVLTFTPPVRVTAVRKSTATANANQVDIDSTITTGANGVVATFKNGAREAVSHVLRLEPLNNTTGSKVSYALSVAILDGSDVKGSANGLNNVDVTALSYTALQGYSFDGDNFLIAARLPRPTSV